MDERSTRIERRLDLPMMVAALVVIPVVVIEASDFGEPWETVGAVLNWATWLAFLAEAVVMLSVVPDRWRWVRTHPIDIAVVVLTPPFATALATFRLLRLLRLVRLLRLARVARRMFTLQGLRYAAVLSILTAIGGGAAFSALEKNQSLGGGIYWAVTTMTTVGYGDLSPATTGGKCLALVVMLVGTGFVAVLTGAVAERFLVTPEPERIEEARDDLDEASAAILEELRLMRARLVDLEAALLRRRV